MLMHPARHNEVPECGEISRWYNLTQFNYRGLVFVTKGEIFKFFSTMRAYKDGEWGIFNLN